jgi:nucleoside-diphosphate-sugar epimerase
MSNILILGGTQFLGRSFVEYLLENNTDSQITICNRGMSNPLLFPHLKKIKCNRNVENECSNLFEDFYDFVFDFSGYEVSQLSNVAKHLRCHKYVYVSTISVLHNYADEKMRTYAQNKKLCEDFVIKNYSNYCIFRPTCVVGDNDNTNRFYKENNEFYWKSSNKKAEECITNFNVNMALFRQIDYKIDKRTVSYEKKL